MKLKENVNLEIDRSSAEYVFNILLDHQSGYSSDFPPERIVKIRKVIDNLKEILYK